MENPASSDETAWYQLTAEEAFDVLHSERSGLSTEEAKARLERYGYNEIKFKKRSAPLRFLAQFNSPLIIILLVCAAITSALCIWEGADLWMDTAVILAVVLANTIIGFIREGKAEASVEALERMMTPECTVVRDACDRWISGG
jgi:magnesium-transporting ATPase (P-type)